MLIIFDCDGVLIDSERILNDVFRECLKDIGLDLPLSKVIQRFKGRSTKDCLKIAEGMLGKPVSVDWLNFKYEEVGAKRFRDEIRPIPGVVEAFEELTQRRCVASSSSHEHIRLGLELTGLISQFREGIFSASDVGRGKPAPDLFLYAASSMGVDPGECVVVEDSPPGVEAGIAAGMTVLGFVDLSPEAELQKAGAQTFCNMKELPSLINRLSA